MNQFFKFSNAAKQTQNYKSVDYSDHIKCKKEAHWLLPQTLAMVARATKLVYTEEGKLDALEMMKENQNLDNLGPEQTNELYKYLTLSPRSEIIGKAEDFLEYSALVPLYMYAFKKYNNIAYSTWDKVQLRFSIDKGLYEAMISTPSEEAVGEGFCNLYDYRDQYCYNGLPPQKAWKINLTNNKEFDKLPRLTKVMLCQTWMAHPSLRNEYMILNPYDWDDMPDPLVSTNISADKSSNDLPPWMC